MPVLVANCFIAPPDQPIDGQISFAVAQKRDPDQILKILARDPSFVWDISGGYQIDDRNKLIFGGGRFLAGDVGLFSNLDTVWPSGFITRGWASMSNVHKLPWLSETNQAEFGIRFVWPIGIADHPSIDLSPEINIHALGRDALQTLDKPLEIRDLVAPSRLRPP